LTPRDFPTEDAARKLIYLAITKPRPNGKRVFNWPADLATTTFEFGERISANT
jgi:hypothetical protein